MPTGSQYDDDLENEELEGSNLVKDLRRQIANLTKANVKLETQLQTFTTQQRSTVLSDALKAKGLNPSAAKFYPADAEVTDEAVTAWITENADVFGPAQATSADETPAPGDPGEGQAQEQGQQVDAPSIIAPEDRAAFQRMQMAGLVGTTATTRDAEVLAGIHAAKSPEELTAFLSSQR